MNRTSPSTSDEEKTSAHGIYQTLLAAFQGRSRRKGGLILDLVSAVGAFLFANTPAVFGAHPFALALICASCGHTLAALIGASLGCLLYGPGGGVYFAVYVSVLLLRTVWSWPGEHRFFPSSEMLYREAPQLRISAAFLGGFALAVYELCVGGVATHTLLFAAGSVLLPPLVTFLFCGVFTDGFALHDFLLEAGVERIKDGRSRVWEQVGILSLLFCGTLALSRYTLFGISLGGIFAMAVLLIGAKRFGGLQGAATGFVAALPLGAIIAPGYGFAGFAAGLLRKKGLFWPMAASIAAGSAWCAYIGGVEGFLGHMPEMAVTALFVWPLSHRIPAFRQATAQGEGQAALPLPPSSGERLSAAFASLSRLLYEEAKKERTPELSEYFSLCDSACAPHCRACEKQSSCWETGDRPALTAMEELASHLYRRAGDAPTPAMDRMLAICDRMPKIRDEIRSGADMLYAKRHSTGNRETAAANFDMVARLLGENAAKERAEAKEDTVLGAELEDALKEIGVNIGRIRVCGERRRRVVASGLRWDGQTLPAEKLHVELERLCGCALSYPGFEMNDGFVTLEMQTVRRYSVHTAVACAPAESDEESGDRTAAFDNREDYFYALLSDGMGSGKEASDTAGLCVGILEEMLMAGNNQETSLRMLNNLIRAGMGECSTTVDLLEVDLLYGKASFIKSGAAASYVKRGENLFRIHSDTAPVGILRTLDAERIHFSVRAGDIIVLLSDGVSQSMEDAPWLLEYLAAPWPESLEESATHILELARSHGGKDDMTVMLAEIRPYRAAESKASA